MIRDLGHETDRRRGSGGWRRGPAVAAALATAILVGAPAPLSAQRAAYEELQTLSGVLNHVRLNYVDSVGYDRLVRAAIEGVLASLDPHSRFVSARDGEAIDRIARGELGEVGLWLEDVDGAVTVLAVEPRSPADRSGVFPGDRLTSVADTPVAGLRAEQLRLRLAGRPGSKVWAGFARGPRLEPDTFRVRLERVVLQRRSVASARLVDSATAYVRLAEFGDDAAAELRREVERLRKRGARQLILDLRANPGGLVRASVEVASEFLPERTTVFRTVGRRRGVHAEYRTSRRGALADLPLMVLIDASSASASEALAGALQDHDRAVILGRRSFGKALMQSPFLVPPADVVWLTVGRVVTPSGRFIQREYGGLTPEQYRDLAGSDGGRDTAQTYRTDAGRPVWGGGGIAPDLELPAPPALPLWWGEAAEARLVEVVADSAANAQSPDSSAARAWIRAGVSGSDDLVGEFLVRVRSRLGIEAALAPEARERLARVLGRRLAEVRWGAEWAEAYALAQDPDVAAALAAFPDLRRLLAAPPGL